MKNKKIVDETHQLWKIYSSERSLWAMHAQEDKEFRLGKQWSKEQEEDLRSKGQAPIVVNRIHPAVEAAKAMITSNRPSFRVSPREDSDNQVAQAINGLLEYVWQKSDGEGMLRRVVDDFYVQGMGVALVYQDPISDMGKGDVRFKHIDPLDVYIDPNSRDPFCDDAANIIISKLFTKEQAIKMEPLFKKEIQASESSQETDRPITNGWDDGATSFPEESLPMDSDGEDTEYVRGYERYTKILTHNFRVFETFNGSEDLMDEEKYNWYINQPVWMINGQIITNPDKAKQALKAVESQQAQQMQQLQMVAQQDPQRAQAMMQQMQQPDIQERLIRDLIDEGIIEVVPVPVWRIEVNVIIGNKHLYKRVLPVEHYPIITFMNLHTGTPYPMSDVRMVKGLQQYINKIRSLIIAHATTSTNTKILIPEGSVDVAEFERKWSQPGVAITYDPTDGAPVPIQPTPLPTELYKNEQDAKNDIDHQLGLYELMMGSSQGAPQTYKATISLDEFGQRKIRSKLAAIESGLRRMAEVAIPMIQQLYTSEKMIRLLQPNNMMSEYMINKRMFDDKGEVLDVINKISTGNYDVIVVAGSTLPTNRYAQLEMYMGAYEKGLIDRVEVLKKTEVFDIEGVLQRTDIIDKLQQQTQAQAEEIKKLRGDLQTREREVYHAKQQAELAKFKANLDSTHSKMKASASLYDHRLQDAQREVSREVQARKERGKPKE